MEGDSSEIGHQQQPQKPHRPTRPKRQREPMAPKGNEAGIGGSLQVSRIIGQRHQQCDDEGKRHTEPDDTIVEKSPHPFAFEASPNEKARQKEEKRHQKDVLPGAKQVEAEPAVAVYDRKRAPEIRGGSERKRGSRQKI